MSLITQEQRPLDYLSNLLYHFRITSPLFPEGGYNSNEPSRDQMQCPSDNPSRSPTDLEKRVEALEEKVLILERGIRRCIVESINAVDPEASIANSSGRNHYGNRS